MSDEMTRTADSTRPPEAFAFGDAGGEEPRRFDNPLVKGLVVLLMMAVATTVLVATDDGDEGSIIAGDTLASEPLAPEADEAITASSVQGVASETAQSEANGAEADGAESWAEAGAAIDHLGVIERLRHEALRDATTVPPTTEAPTTTVPPTTAAPTTAPPATESPTTTAAAVEATETTQPAGDGSETTETTAPTTETTTVEEPTTTAPPTTAAPETTTTASGDGWVDAGNGVLVPPVLLAIRWCESRDDYQAANRSSSARGAYQFIKGSWAAYGHADRYGVSEAHYATNAQQDEAALLTWERDGTRPWNASRSCWSSRI